MGVRWLPFVLFVLFVLFSFFRKTKEVHPETSRPGWERICFRPSGFLVVLGKRDLLLVLLLFFLLLFLQFLTFISLPLNAKHTPVCVNDVANVLREHIMEERLELVWGGREHQIELAASPMEIRHVSLLVFLVVRCEDKRLFRREDVPIMSEI